MLLIIEILAVLIFFGLIGFMSYCLVMWLGLISNRRTIERNGGVRYFITSWRSEKIFDHEIKKIRRDLRYTGWECSGPGFLFGDECIVIGDKFYCPLTPLMNFLSHRRIKKKLQKLNIIPEIKNVRI